MADDNVTWHVDGQNVRQETTLGPGNSGLVTSWIVPYIIDSGPAKGTSQSVAVSPADFTEAGVKEAIAVHVNNVHRVAGLSG